jgi:predicted ABC-type ATPase
MDEKPPQLQIIAGPNGSGKTTFVRTFLPRFAAVRNFVNADLIAAGLSPFAPETVSLAAGRLMLGEIRRLASLRADFAFETTLSGRTYEPILRQFREQGYTIHLYFLWLPDVALNLVRVAHRVQQGGHNVPEKDVRRRYGRGIANFIQVYRGLADHWIVFDNSAMWPREIAYASGADPVILDAVAFQEFTQTGSIS